MPTTSGEPTPFLDFLKQQGIESLPDDDGGDPTTLNIRGIDSHVKETLERRAGARGLTYAELLARYSTLHTTLLILATTPGVSPDSAKFARFVLEGVKLGPIVL